MVKITLGRGFQKEYSDLIKEHPELKEVAATKVSVFQNNPQDTRLRNHALKTRLAGKYAFSITQDIRIVYEHLGETTVRFIAIGTHWQLYGK